MKHATYDSQSGCPVEVTLSVIGGKWKGIIIYHLMGGTVRYNELQRMLPNTTPRMLTKQLRELEHDGVIHREVYPQVPPKVEYSLTEFGRSLIPIVTQMETWGNQYMSNAVQEESLGTASNKRVEQLKQSFQASEAAHNPAA